MLETPKNLSTIMVTILSSRLSGGELHQAKLGVVCYNGQSAGNQ
jgi:hypothetical protein